MINVGRLWQFHAAFASGLGSLVMGVLTVWPSYTSVLYSSNSTTILSEPMTKLEGSLLGSIPSLGATIGTVIAGTILDKFGRKNGGIILNIPYVISWIIIGISSSIKTILAARFLAGIAGGGTMILAPVLISEVSEDAIRGALASNSMLMYCGGMLLSYVMGWFLTYKTIIWINIILSLASTALLALVDESPIYLLRNGMEKKAISSIARYRGVPVSSKIVLDELSKRRQQILSSTEYKPIIDCASTDIEKAKLKYIETQPKNFTFLSSVKMLFQSPSSRRAFLVVMTIMSAQVLMGMLLIQVYASTIFTETDPSKSDLYTVLFAVLQFIACFIVSAVADKTGRRVLQISSSALVGLCLVSLGYLLQFKVTPSWVIVVFIMAYCFFFMVGAGSVPYVLLAEVFTLEVLNLATMLIIEWVWLLNFFVIAIFPYVIECFGIHGAFYGFAAVSLANTIISYFILPETAGLSNEDIQKVFLPRLK